MDKNPIVEFKSRNSKSDSLSKNDANRPEALISISVSGLTMMASKKTKTISKDVSFEEVKLNFNPELESELEMDSKYGMNNIWVK